MEDTREGRVVQRDETRRAHDEVDPFCRVIMSTIAGDALESDLGCMRRKRRRRNQRGVRTVTTA